MFQHTAARRRLDKSESQHQKFKKFQHTAARRRLVLQNITEGASKEVSTHSRPKAAGSVEIVAETREAVVSTHSRPKAAGGVLGAVGVECFRFNTQPPEGGW